MKALLIIILLASILFAGRASASDCTKRGTVGTTSVQVETANDVGPAGVGVQGRHYMLIQNTGQSVGLIDDGGGGDGAWGRRGSHLDRTGDDLGLL